MTCRFQERWTWRITLIRRDIASYHHSINAWHYIPAREYVTFSWQFTAVFCRIMCLAAYVVYLLECERLLFAAIFFPTAQRFQFCHSNTIAYNKCAMAFVDAFCRHSQWNALLPLYSFSRILSFKHSDI